MSIKPRIAITIGDVFGIGPEITLKAIKEKSITELAKIIVVGDEKFLKARIPNVEFLNIPCNLKKTSPGRPSASAGLASYDFIKAAVKLAIEKKVDAVVTAPVSKVSLRLAGIKYHGHTEMLKDLTTSPEVEMIMVAGKMKSMLLTRHIPISDVPKNISVKKIVSAVKLLLEYFGRDIKIAVCSLNPHASDGGIIGGEEKKIIEPAIRVIEKEKVKILGPMPPDVAFLKMSKGCFDFCVAMYHDQAMLPLKVTHPNRIVNVTLGLPFLRTSPGHGTAFDIAGKNLANPSAMIEAVKFAIRNYRLWRN